jgi:hypothetical protein
MIPQDVRAPLDFGIFQADKRFCRANALVMSTMGSLAYHSPHDQMEWATQQPSLKALHCLDSKNNQLLGCAAPDTGTQVSVVETDKALLVAARGTPLTLLPKENAGLQWQDLANDCNTWPVANYNQSGRVAAGFKRAADGIWEQLKPLLSQAMASHKAIHFSGHSLGAAIATHLADRMHHEMQALPVSLTTLGAPDVGWAGERRHLRSIGLEERTLRFVNNLDPAPALLPFGQPLGTTIYFDSQGRAQLGDQGRGLDRLRGLGLALLRLQLNPLQDHFPQEYRTLIAAPENAATLNSLE